MSSSITLRGVQLLPLWRRRIPKYPIYWKGDPQIQVFLPHFWMRMVKPENEIPKNHIHFEVHPQMSKFDIKNYLEKIYKVPIISVRTSITKGEDIKHKTKDYVMTREDDRKYAYLVLAEGQEFEFPDIFKDEVPPMEKELKKLNQIKRADLESEQESWEKAALPPWFR